MRLDYVFLERFLHWTALTVYAWAAASFLVASAVRRDSWRRFAACALVIGLGLHTVALGARWAAAGHLPALSRYEIFSVLAWMTVAAFAAVCRLRRDLVGIGVVVGPSALLLLGYALLGSPSLKSMPQNFDPLWLIVHGAFSALAFGLTLMGTAMAWSGVLQGRRRRPASVPAEPSTPQPSSAVLDELSERLLGLGFLAQAVMLVSGSLWANIAWGAYWGWEPVETWSLVAWLVYGVYLHLRRTYGWRGQPAAWAATFGFALFLFALWGLGTAFGDQHSRYFQ